MIYIDGHYQVEEMPLIKRQESIAGFFHKDLGKQERKLIKKSRRVQFAKILERGLSIKEPKQIVQIPGI